MAFPVLLDKVPLFYITSSDDSDDGNRDRSSGGGVDKERDNYVIESISEGT